MLVKTIGPNNPLVKVDVISLSSRADASILTKLEAPLQTHFANWEFRLYNPTPESSGPMARIAGDIQYRTALFRSVCLSDSKVVWFMRGGVGSLDLVEPISAFLSTDEGKASIRNKIFVGYSDVTALLNYLARWEYTTCLHSAMLFELIDDKKINNVLITKDLIENIINGRNPNNDQALFSNLRKLSSSYNQPFVSVGSAAEPAKIISMSTVANCDTAAPPPIANEDIRAEYRDELSDFYDRNWLAFNMCIMQRSWSTAWEIGNMKGSVLFIEEIGESSGHIHGILIQLHNTIARSIRTIGRSGCPYAIVLGSILTQGQETRDLETLRSINNFAEMMGALGVHVFKLETFGHGKCNMPIQLGYRAADVRSTAAAPADLNSAGAACVHITKDVANQGQVPTEVTKGQGKQH
jgi:muramoyltetrapeptide carboxypeptidase LdcA involved in peptidoglycan recycling